MKEYSWGEPDSDLVEEDVVMCPRCGEHPAKVDRTFGVMPCEYCVKSDRVWRDNHPGIFAWPSSSEAFASNRSKRKRDKQRRHHAKDLIQPKDNYGNINKDFKKTYGFNPFEKEKKAREEAKHEREQQG